MADAINSDFVQAAVALYNGMAELLTNSGWRSSVDISPVGYWWKHENEAGCFTMGAAIKCYWLRQSGFSMAIGSATENK